MVKPNLMETRNRFQQVQHAKGQEFSVSPVECVGSAAAAFLPATRSVALHRPPYTGQAGSVHVTETVQLSSAAN